jgi:hypothetical protein
MATAIPIEAAELKQRIERFQEVHREIVRQVRRVIVGQEEVLEQVLIALFVGGHCLLVGVPGLAKTLLVRTLRAGAGPGVSSRIQFTPDLMPSDITGTDSNRGGSGPPGRVQLDGFVKGPDLRQRAAGRRDQPHAAQDASPRCWRRCRNTR